MYKTANTPANPPTNPVPVQYLSYAERECHVMQLDAAPEPGLVFTAEMGGCNTYTLVHPAHQPMFIHCNANLLTSNSYVTYPAGT